MEEGRVLGCLVEKELTTPLQYPLTDNALIAACNQSTSRDPVVNYDVAAVRMAVRGLRDQGLLRTVHRTGERSDKHQHELATALDLATPAQVLLAVLLLRGPQTAAELRARTERMHPFATVEQVVEELEALAARPEPLVARLPRQPGRKEDRFGQLLCDSPPQSYPAAQNYPAASSDPAPQRTGLAAEVAALRAEVAELRALVFQVRDSD